MRPMVSDCEMREIYSEGLVTPVETKASSRIAYLEREWACQSENLLTLILALLIEISHELWFLGWLDSLVEVSQ